MRNKEQEKLFSLKRKLYKYERELFHNYLETKELLESTDSNSDGALYNQHYYEHKEAEQACVTFIHFGLSTNMRVSENKKEILK